MVFVFYWLILFLLFLSCSPIHPELIKHFLDVLLSLFFLRNYTTGTLFREFPFDLFCKCKYLLFKFVIFLLPRNLNQVLLDSRIVVLFKPNLSFVSWLNAFKSFRYNNFSYISGNLMFISLILIVLLQFFYYSQVGLWVLLVLLSLLILLPLFVSIPIIRAPLTVLVIILVASLVIPLVFPVSALFIIITIIFITIVIIIVIIIVIFIPAFLLIIIFLRSLFLFPLCHLFIRFVAWMSKPLFYARLKILNIFKLTRQEFL